MATYTRTQLEAMKPEELWQAALDSEANTTGVNSVEGLINAIMATQKPKMPEWLRDEPSIKVTARDDMPEPGLIRKAISTVEFLNRWFNEHQAFWEFLQTALNSKYTTEDEVRKIVQTELEAFRRELLEQFGPLLKALQTEEKADDVSGARKAWDWLNQPVGKK